MPLMDSVNNFQKHWLEQTFDDYDQTTLRKPRKRDYFSPSSAHWCPRAIWYHTMGTPQDPINSNSLRRMEIGTVYHEFVQTRLEKTGILVSMEEEVTWDDPKMLGHYDGIVKNPETDEDNLLEIKSMAEPKNKKYLQYLPKPEHILQWNLYSAMTKVVKGIIFYINKNSQQYYIYETQRNDQIISKVFRKLRKVRDYVDRGEIVPYQPKENHDWCNFKSTCERDYFIKGM